MTGTLNDVLAYVGAGGVVIWPLFALGLTLWFLVGLRLLWLRGGDGWTVRHDEIHLTAGRVAHPLVMCRRIETELGRFGGGIRAIVAAAPLLGLLGTVHGMVETFHGLTARALFAQSGGVAGGISEALVTTQVGLVVAIPGLFVGRLLDRRATRLRRSLARLRRGEEARAA